MGTLGNPKEWIPYMKSKECTQQICSLSCPQWCYIIFPPPPPFAFPDDQSQSTRRFSPLVIAIIGILASAFLLASYYAIISKFCGNSESSRSWGENNQPQDEETLDDHNEGNNSYNHDNHEPWFISTKGLDEALIKKITLVKYKKSDGLIGSGDCSVCLGEFVEDDSLRLLPKCSHAFHVACIDTWLKSHSNCPLCRANIFSIVPQPVHLPLTSVLEYSNTNTNNSNNNNHPQEQGSSSSQNQVDNLGNSSSEEASEMLPKNPFRTFSDLGRLGLRKTNPHLLNDVSVGEENVIRRSISMDHSDETRVSISEIVRVYQEEDCCQDENCDLQGDQALKMGVGESSSKGGNIGNGSSNYYGKNGVLQSVMRSVALKRSFSSGTFLFSKHSRGSNNTVTPA